MLGVRVPRGRVARDTRPDEGVDDFTGTCAVGDVKRATGGCVLEGMRVEDGAAVCVGLRSSNVTVWTRRVAELDAVAVPVVAAPLAAKGQTNGALHSGPDAFAKVAPGAPSAVPTAMSPGPWLVALTPLQRVNVKFRKSP
jgi:hypothetical protein